MLFVWLLSDDKDKTKEIEPFVEENDLWNITVFVVADEKAKNILPSNSVGRSKVLYASDCTPNGELHEVIESGDVVQIVVAGSSNDETIRAIVSTATECNVDTVTSDRILTIRDNKKQNTVAIRSIFGDRCIPRNTVFDLLNVSRYGFPTPNIFIGERFHTGRG